MPPTDVTRRRRLLVSVYTDGSGVEQTARSIEQALPAPLNAKVRIFDGTLAEEVRLPPDKTAADAPLSIGTDLAAAWAAGYAQALADIQRRLA